MARHAWQVQNDRTVYSGIIVRLVEVSQKFQQVC